MTLRSPLALSSGVIHPAAIPEFFALPESWAPPRAMSVSTNPGLVLVSCRRKFGLVHSPNGKGCNFFDFLVDLLCKIICARLADAVGCDRKRGHLGDLASRRTDDNKFGISLTFRRCLKQRCKRLVQYQRTDCVDSEIIDHDG